MMSAITLWFLVFFSSVNGGYTALQIGPFQDRAACERAHVAAKEARSNMSWVSGGVCVADRTEPK